MERMPDIPIKQGRKLADNRTPSERARDEWMANRGKPSTPPAKGQTAKELEKEYREEYIKERAAGLKRPKETWEKRKAEAKKKVNRVQSSIAKKRNPPTKASLQGGAGYKESQHPRDRAGRFAVKAVKATVKGVGKVARGTAKAIKGTHKVVKRAYSTARRNDALAHRERKLDLHKRELAAGLKKPRTARRKPAAPTKKQGGLFGFLGGSQKKQVRKRK
jgi:hypothetical protein